MRACGETSVCVQDGDAERCVLSLRIALAHAERWQRTQADLRMAQSGRTDGRQP